MDIKRLLRPYIDKYERGGRVRGYDDGGGVDDADQAAMMPETFVNPFVKAVAGGLGDTIAGPGRYMQPNPYKPGSEEGDWYEGERAKFGEDWARNTALQTMGTGAIAGVPVKGAETILGAGPVRRNLVKAADEPQIQTALKDKAGVDVPEGVGGPSGGAEGVRKAQLQAEQRAAGREALPGLPQGKVEVDGEPFIPGPVARAHDVAEQYMADKDFGVPNPDRFHEIDKEHARAIGKAFDEMEHAPHDPEVKAAYEAMIRETLAQYQAIKASGLKITPTGLADYPYQGNPRAVVKDIADNNHMAYFRTRDGFGVGEQPDVNLNPLLRPSGEKIGNEELLNNDIFRIVHDYFGHVKNGNGFRGAGEDNAWRSHAAMYSDLARRAMTTETRGQNSWLNYGPHGDFNRTASAADTIYAPQKIGVMPEWTMRDRTVLPEGDGTQMVPTSSLRPRPENTAMIEKFKKRDADSEATFAEAYPGEQYEPKPGDARYKVDEIRDAIQSGKKLPPLSVHPDGLIEDGENRWNAYKAEGHDMVPVRVIRDEPASAPRSRPYYEGDPITNAGVNAPPNKKIQTVADPHRMMFPGIYRNPRAIAEEAASRVGPEDPAMERLFGVTRGDLREMNQGRVGNEEPNLRQAQNPRGSLAAQNIQTPKNTQRLGDIIDEAGKHEGLRTADAWYNMDPVYHRLEQMFGPEEAKVRYRHLNTMMGMASPGSDVLTEIQRGSGAHWLEQQGRFNDFKKFSGLTGDARNSPKVPRDMRYIGGHPYHGTSQVEPMEKYLQSGSIQSEKPKVPSYVHASGTPETGFQTSGPVGDSHFSRGVGLADTRRGPSNVESALTKPEYGTLQPWWQHDVAGKLGLESVPAQARLWTTLGPQTGVESKLGAPKLELFAKQIMKAAQRLKVSPETARDLILSGKAGAGVLVGATTMGQMMPRKDEEHFASGGVAGYADAGAVPVSAAADDPDFAAWKAQNAAPPAAASHHDPEFVAWKKAQPMSATDVLSGALTNLPASAAQFGSDIVRPFTHPIETATGIGGLGMGLLEKAGRKMVEAEMPEEAAGVEGPHEKNANAMGEYLADRYGGWENVKKSFSQDPVGVLSDASMILTGGGTAAERMPGILGKVGEVASTLGRGTDPLMAPVNLAKVGMGTIAELGTHTGAASLENAYRSGVEGGEAGETFRDNMRGQVGPEGAVETARKGVSNMAKERSESYVSDMAAIGKHPEIMDWDKVNDALNKNATVKNFKGVDISPETTAVRNKIRDAIYKWGELPPETYHTAAGFDALKQMIGEMRDAEPYGTPGRNVADRAYNAIRSEIVKQVPEYGAAMKNYENASALIKEMNTTLSLKPGGNIDTPLRKLQSIMRNNVNTNYGHRMQLGQLLEDNGADHLMAALAGQSLNAWFPRGLGKLEAAGVAMGAMSHPVAAAALPFMSPRLMGETSHAVGRTIGRGLDLSNRALGRVGLNNRAAGNLSYRLGRTTNPFENSGGPFTQ